MKPNPPNQVNPPNPANPIHPILKLGILSTLAIILFFLYKGLTSESADVTKEGKFPDFALKDIRDNKTLHLSDIKGQVSIVHVWASWCGICVREHAQWVSIHEEWPYKIVSIVYRDDPKQIIKILEAKGDPYQYVLDDQSGSVGLDLGLRGTPETYIVDKEGQIRFHHLGPISMNFFKSDLLPLLRELEGGST